MKTYYYGNEESGNILLQMIGEHELTIIENEVIYIRELADSDDFFLVAIKVDDWNKELSPWPAPAVFGEEAFGGLAEDTLNELLEIIETDIFKGRDKEKLQLYIGGYSLSGLFALWTSFQTDIFKGIMAASPSVWFPGFDEYVQKNEIKADKVYLSLGNKESKTRNPVMAQVGDKLQSIYDYLSDRIDAALEWNDGNHFKEPDLRIAKGFAWILKEK